MPSKQLNWVDLSEYQLSLTVINLSTGARFLVLQGGEHAPKAAEALGFFYNDKLNAWLMRGNKFMPSQFVDTLKKAGFDKAAIKKMDVSNIIIQHSQNNKPPSYDEEDANKDTSPSKPLYDDKHSSNNVPDHKTVEPPVKERKRIFLYDRDAREEFMEDAKYINIRNRLNDAVYEKNGRRFFVNNDAEVIWEEDYNENSPDRPSLFLRAPDENNLELCADGFARDLISTYRRDYTDQFSKFLTAIYERKIDVSDPEYSQAALSIEKAILRQSVKQETKTLSQFFNASLKYHNLTPYSGSVLKASGTSFLPTPLTTGIHRIYDLRKNGNESSLHVVNSGLGSLVAGLTNTINLSLKENNDVSAGHASSTLGRRSARKTKFAKSVDHKSDILIYNLLNDTHSDSEIAKIVRDTMSARFDKQYTLFMLPHVASESMNSILPWIAQRYEVEGVSELSPNMVESIETERPFRLIAVGKARAELLSEPPEASLRVRYIDNFADFWSWTTEVISNRAKLIDYNESLTKEDASDHSNKDAFSNEENSLQKPYKATSSIGQSTSMIPRNLEGPLNEAFASLVNRRGNIDDWVARRAAMSKKELATLLTPEQVDAVALGLDAMDRGRGFMNADITGLGKGRVKAMLMRICVLEDKKIMLFMEKGISFTDMWRDIKAVNADELIDPFIVNGNIQIINREDKTVVAKSPKTSELKATIESGEWPEDHNAIFLTYSQCNRDHLKSKKISWLRDIVDDNTLIVEDESHNASSRNSNTSSNLEHIEKSAASVLYASATFARDSKTMSYYTRLFPDDMDADNLMETIKQGGESMQEIVSMMLVRDGVMIRREHDASRVEYVSHYDAENEEYNLQMMDCLAPIISELRYLTGDITKRVHKMGVGLEKIEQVARSEAAMQRLGVELGEDYHVNDENLRRHRGGYLYANFGSILEQINTAFMSSIKNRAAIQASLNCLGDNIKPIIVYDKTFQSAFQDLEDLRKKLGIDVGSKPNIRDILYRVLDRMVRLKHYNNGQMEEINLLDEPEVTNHWRRIIFERAIINVDENLLQADDPLSGVKVGDVREEMHKSIFLITQDIAKHMDEEDQQLGVYSALTILEEELSNIPTDASEAAPVLRDLLTKTPQTIETEVFRIRSMIDSMPNVSLTVIDDAIKAIEDAGYTCGELTGRTIQYKDGKLQKRKRPNTIEVQDAFNNGGFDALVINELASTSIDLNSSFAFADQRQRALVFNTIFPKITKYQQVLGRIMRLNQANDPMVVNISIGLPAEIAADAAVNTRMRRMSANVTSNRESASLLKGIPDIINSIGDSVVGRFLEARPALSKKLGYDLQKMIEQDRMHNRPRRRVNKDGSEDSSDKSRSAHKFLKNVGSSLLVEEQKQIIEEIMAEFEMTVKELDDKGINPLKTRKMEGKVTLLDKYVFEGSDAEAKDSVFHEPVYANKVMVEKKVKPISVDKLEKLMESGLDKLATEGPGTYASRLRQKRDRILRPYLPIGCASIEQAIEQNISNVKTASDNLDRLINTLDVLRIGSEITFTDIDDSQLSGIVINIEMPNTGSEHILPGYVLTLAVPNEQTFFRGGLNMLFKDEEFSVKSGLNGEDYDGIMEAFENAKEGIRKENMIVMDGNLFRAMTLNQQENGSLGSIKAYDIEGTGMTRGLVVSKKYKDVDFIPARFTNLEMVREAVLCGIDIRSTQKTTGSRVTIQHDAKNRNFQIQLPGRRNVAYRSLFNNPYIESLITETKRKHRDEGKKKTPRIILSVDEVSTFDRLLRELNEHKVQFYASGKYRDWMNSWLSGKGENVPDDDDTNENSIEEDDISIDIKAA